MRTLALVAFIVLAGCIDLSGSKSNIEGEEGDGGDSDGCKIEGDQIGSDGLVMRLGSTSITFSDWVTKPGEPAEYMGFSLSITGAASVGYVVKAGTETFPSRATTWSADGLTNHAISNVDVCEECDDGSCDGGGDGSGSDGGGDGSGSDGPIL